MTSTECSVCVSSLQLCLSVLAISHICGSAVFDCPYSWLLEYLLDSVSCGLEE